MKPRIVGIVMVKNEDVWILDVLGRISGFCDYVRLIDTGSTDKTIEEARRALTAHRCEHDIVHVNELTRTHEQVEAYVGTNTWVFGVDGDELYDPAGLARMRERIKAGYGAFAYQVKGMYLHANMIAHASVEGQTKRIATGWFGPPSHNPTKLYNFANVEAWPCDYERTLFHCKTRRLRTESTLLHAVTPWSASDLRCIHLRWLPRSSEDSGSGPGRLTPEDLIGKGNRKDRGNRDDANERLQYQKGEKHALCFDTFEEITWPFD